MPVSFLLRLVPSALAKARIVGRIEAVETGVTVPIRSADDLVAFLLSCAPSSGTGGADGAGSPAARENGHGEPGAT